MKILIDNSPTSYSRIENENSEHILQDEIKSLKKSLKEITNISKTLSFYIVDSSNLLNDIKFKNDNSIEDFNKLVEFVNSEKSLLEFPELASKLKNTIFSPFFQKVTYEIEDGENFDKVVEILLNQKSYAILKFLYADKEKAQIRVYSSVFGLWNIENNLFFKKIENKSKDNLRTQFTITKVTDTNSLQKEINRTNFAVYEDLKTLFEARVIERAYKYKLINGEWKTDDTKFNITKFHFNITQSTPTEIDTKAKENLSQKQSKLNRGSVTQKDVKENIEKNPNKIHTILKNAKLNEFEEIKSSNIEKFKQTKLNQMKEEFELKIKEFELEEIEAEKQKIECKKEYIELLQNGMSLNEAKHTLKSRYLDLTIVLVEEDIKSDIVALKEIGGVNGYLKTQNKAIEFEQKNRTNYKNYLKELELRQKRDKEVTQLNLTLQNYKTELEKSHKALEESNELIIKLKDAIKERDEAIEQRDKNINELESELDLNFNEIEKLKNEKR